MKTNLSAVRDFPVSEGIEVQREQLAKWEKLLKPEVFARLKPRVERDNHLAETGDDVCRGIAIEEILVNEIAAVV